MFRNILKEYITTVIGLMLLVFMSINLYDVSKGVQEFNWMFTTSLLVIGLTLLISTDKWIKTLLNRIIGVAADKI